VREWFAPLRPRTETDPAKRYGAEKEALTVPTFSLQVADRQSAGVRHVFDLAVDGPHAFVAGTFAVHNCIGNSGPLPEAVSEAVQESNLVVASVLSGNRNFEGRIHPEVRASYLASPPLVVAYALAGSIDKDLTKEPLGHDPDGQPVFLTNNAGGILGGISTGQPLVARFAVKPTSSILTPRRTVDRFGRETEISTKGRHDPCVGIRAVPIGEAMVACVVADHYLRQRGQVGEPPPWPFTPPGGG